jgi:predicted metal-dependent hydrolase
MVESPFFCPLFRSGKSMDEIKINKIIRSKRKTIALIITQDATLVVRAPLRTPFVYINSLVRKKSFWIRKKLLELSKKPKPPIKEFVNGEEFFYLGKPYKLCIVENSDIEIEFKDKLYLSERAMPGARDVLKRWYKSEALKIIRERCEWYQGVVGCKPISIKITEAKKRWGSCGRKGSLNFSWRLIMAPMEVIDYLIVHELAHIGQLNHSKAYWSKVRSVLPDYAIREKWLKEYDGLLMI